MVIRMVQFRHVWDEDEYVAYIQPLIHAFIINNQAAKSRGSDSEEQEDIASDDDDDEEEENSEEGSSGGGEDGGESDDDEDFGGKRAKKRAKGVSTSLSSRRPTRQAAQAANQRMQVSREVGGIGRLL